MRYLGGKSKIAKRLASVIGGGDLLIEPFVGGGSMTAILAQQFRLVEASDIHEDLILLWRALQEGWVPPRSVSEADYVALRVATPSALRGFVGFAGASWGGKWFGGYARGEGRNYADEAVRSLLRDIQQMSNVAFSLRDYRTINPPRGSVVYADPPYANTTGYSAKFDSIEFWQIMLNWVDGGSRVFVSEYAAPPGWDVVWEQRRTRDMKSRFTNAVSVIERLFYRGPVIETAGDIS